MTVSTTNVFSKWRMLWHFFVSRLSIPGREETGTHLEKSVQYWNWRLSCICCCCCHFESAVVIPANHVLICTQGEVCCIISKALKPIRGSNDTVSLCASLPPPQCVDVSTALRVTHIAGSSQTAHTHILTLNSVMGAFYTTDRKPLFGPQHFLQGQSHFAPTHQI